MATHITAARLTQLRAEAAAANRAAGGFVDPTILHRACRVLDQRGEPWAAAILGRDISRRSLAAPHRPWLRAGEDRALVAADAEEDRAAIAHLDPDDHS